MTKIIAELGINHNGSRATLIKMVEEAAAAGVDYVKIQKRNVDLCYTNDELDAQCVSPWGKTVEAKVRGRELSWDDVREMACVCSSIGIGWGCSCFDLTSLSELWDLFGHEKVAKSLEFSFHKIPSAMALHPEFVSQVAGYGKLTLISCGLAADPSGIADVTNFFEEAKTDYVLNVTTALYPCPNDRCNLNRIKRFKSIKDAFPCCRAVGYSGHETGILPSVIAAQMGAEWIERHFTLDRSMYGADQSASLEPEGLRRLVRDIRELEKIRGSGEIHLYGDEKNPVPHLSGGGE